MEGYDVSYKRFGERAILIEWPAIIDRAVLKDVILFKSKIEESYDSTNVQLTHAYQSLVIYFFKNEFKYDKEVDSLKKIYSNTSENEIDESKIWTIPVCYDTEFGIDLEDISKNKDISKKEIIRMHSEAIYPIYFIGFLPGFLYLGGLNELLYTPRRDSPRLKVAEGSVAIGGKQTGIYPSESPGGWHIIGRSPIQFFKASNNPPCFAKAGDYVKFCAISLKEYYEIKKAVESGVYVLESEVTND